MVWYAHLFQNFPQFIVIHTVKGFGIVNKAEIDIFLELSCYFDDPADVSNLISGSSAFSKTSLIDHTCVGLFLETQFCLDQWMCWARWSGCPGNTDDLPIILIPEDIALPDEKLRTAYFNKDS